MWGGCPRSATSTSTSTAPTPFRPWSCPAGCGCCVIRTQSTRTTTKAPGHRFAGCGYLADPVLRRLPWTSTGTEVGARRNRVSTVEVAAARPDNAAAVDLRAHPRDDVLRHVEQALDLRLDPASAV